MTSQVDKLLKFLTSLESTFLTLETVNNIVDAKNSLDNSVGGDSCPSQFVKPPANLVVLEGDCLDTSGDGGELESYLVYSIFFHPSIVLENRKSLNSVFF